MNYEAVSFFIVGIIVLSLKISRRWIQWPFSLRALFWCGAFSYMVLLSLPRVFVLNGADMVIQISFWLFSALLISLIMSYHNF